MDKSKLTKGRCRHGTCERKPGFSWPRSLMRVTEAICPRCGSMLHASSWDFAKGFTELLAYQVRDMLDHAIYVTNVQIESVQAQLAAPELHAFEASLLADRRATLKRRVEDMRARRGRAAKLHEQEARDGARVVGKAINEKLNGLMR